MMLHYLYHMLFFHGLVNGALPACHQDPQKYHLSGGFGKAFHPICELLGEEDIVLYLDRKYRDMEEHRNMVRYQVLEHPKLVIC